MTTTTPETTATQPTAAELAITYGAPAVAGVLGAYASWQAGKINQKIFLGSASQILHLSRVSITFATEVAIAAMLPGVRPIGVGATDYDERDRASLQTVTDDPDRAAQRVEQFVMSTLHQYAADERIAIGAEYGATGWRWVADGANCDYCADRDGQEFGLDVEFRDHPNCNCYPEAIFDAGFSNLAHVESESEND